MSTTTAAELAAARTRWPQWSIRPVDSGKGIGFTAHRRAAAGLAAVWAPDLTALEKRMGSYRETVS